jgi:Ala-tRNA(Pro) deacylase
LEPNELENNRRERVYALLNRLGIEYEIVEHPAMFSAADNELHERDINATIFKNLFLRNKDKSRYYLYSLPIMKRADLAALASHISETRFSFGNEGELWNNLRIRPGSVSPLNVIDAPETDVEILIDCEIFNFSEAMQSQQEYCIIAEGYMDVITLVQNGKVTIATISKKGSAKAVFFVRRDLLPKRSLQQCSPYIAFPLTKLLSTLGISRMRKRCR